MARTKALWLLTIAVLKTLLRRIFSKSKLGIAAFHANYDSDGLPALTAAERSELPQFSGCIACGLCDRDEEARIKASSNSYRGLMSLVLAASRNMPDYRAASRSFDIFTDVILEQKEQICPANIPFRMLANFVRKKAAAMNDEASASSSSRS